MRGHPAVENLSGSQALPRGSGSHAGSPLGRGVEMRRSGHRHLPEALLMAPRHGLGAHDTMRTLVGAEPPEPLLPVIRQWPGLSVLSLKGPRGCEIVTVESSRRPVP